MPGEAAISRGSHARPTTSKNIAKANASFWDRDRTIMVVLSARKKAASSYKSIVLSRGRRDLSDVRIWWSQLMQ